MAPDEVPGPWLTKAEAADRLRVDVRTIDRWVESGHLIRYTTPGGHARFRTEDVDALLREDEK
jgi:excisionase family DNA binding protein